MNHLVFYDGECGLCNRVVQFVIKRDANKIFLFAPLQGETAKRLLITPPDDTSVLIENVNTSKSKTYIRSKGIFRILWLLGGFWTVPGALFFLPAFLFDWAYRLVAKYRVWIPAKNLSCQAPTPEEKKRFLP